MINLIKNGEVYAPDYLGRQDILMAYGKIIRIQPKINISPKSLVDQEIDASDNIILPGFIDQHVHIIGGGGEGGPITRAPEIQLSQLTTAGITTVIGVLGVDDITRNMISLLAKAKALESEGISTYIYSGAYTIPTATFTGNIRSDLVLIDKVLGVGEIAISDHRSAQPTLEIITKLAAEARVGGLLSNKAGIVHIHVGEGKQGLSLLFQMVNTSDIPITQLIPTHINRSSAVFKEGVKFLKLGGAMDLTAGIKPESDTPDALEVYQALKSLITDDVSLEKVTVSSDGNGSLPKFDSLGQLTQLTIGSVKVLWEDVRKAVENNIIPLPVAASLITRNVARLLKLLPYKGIVAVGSDADLVILNRDLDIVKVFARGQQMVENGLPLVKGRFE